MLNVMVTGLLCISMLLVASSCNLCLFTVKFYWNIKKKKKILLQIRYPEKRPLFGENCKPIALYFVENSVS